MITEASPDAFHAPLHHRSSNGHGIARATRAARCRGPRRVPHRSLELPHGRDVAARNTSLFTAHDIAVRWQHAMS
ncbi:hypothetical protein A7982_12309 [Minicystis rosea]|nr:hypothetical protein A7982_12309 [Minicystis rosea]